MKVLLNSFHLNGHTLEFHPDLKIKTTLHMKVLLNSFNLNGHSLWLIKRLKRSLIKWLPCILQKVLLRDSWYHYSCSNNRHKRLCF